MASPTVVRKNAYVPSGFHGGMDVFLGMKGVVPILHGPGGCTCYVWTNIMRSDCITRFSCSTVLDDELISSGGSIDKLKSLIEHIERQYAPELIPVVSTHISDTIGEDVEGFVHHLGNEKVVHVDSKSLRNDEDSCKADVLKLLAERYATTQTRLDGSVNIIGPSLNTFNWRSDVAELTELVAKLGLRVNAVFPLNCSVQEVRALPQAALNLVMYSYGLPAAEYLRERFGVDYVQAFPVGFESTIRFVHALEERLHVDASQPLRAEMERYFSPFSDVILSPWHDHLSNELRTFAAVGSATHVVAIAEFLTREVGMTPQLIAAVDGVPKAEIMGMLAARGVDAKVVLAGAKAAEVEEWLKRLVPSVILGSDYEEKVADELKAAFISIAHPSMVTTSLAVTPLWGFRGGALLVQEILRKGTGLLKNIRAISVSTKGPSIDMSQLKFARAWTPDALDKYEYVAGLIPKFLGDRIGIAQRFITLCERVVPQDGTVGLKHVEESFVQVEAHFVR